MKRSKPDFFVYCLNFMFFFFLVSAFYFECPEKQMCMNASIYTKSRFYGMSIGVNLIGKGIGSAIAVILLIYIINAIFLGCHLLLLFYPSEALSVICLCPSSQPAIVGARGGVCIRNAQCLCPLHTDRTMGRNGRQDLYHLCQNWLFVSYYLPY